MEPDLSQVQALTDKELRDELIKFGENPGPINSTTRGVYQRKLAKLKEGGTSVRGNFTNRIG